MVLLFQRQVSEEEILKEQPFIIKYATISINVIVAVYFLYELQIPYFPASNGIVYRIAELSNVCWRQNRFIDLHKMFHVSGLEEKKTLS